METLLIIFPPPENGTRTFSSHFQTGSPKLKAALQKAVRSMTAGGDAGVIERRLQVYWPPHHYNYGDEEARYALALNAANIILTTERGDEDWIIHSSVKVKVRYVKESFVTLFHEPELKVEEGLFWVLQEEGWLHTYIAEYVFSFTREEILSKDF